MNPLKARSDAWSLSDTPHQTGRTILVTGVHPRRPRPLHRPRTGPPRRPRGAGRPHARQARRLPSRRPWSRSPARRARQAGRRPRRPLRPYAARRPRAGSFGGLWTSLAQQRRRTRWPRPYAAHRRRSRAAYRDQPLRALPADRAVVPAAGGQRGRDRVVDGVPNLPPDGPVRAARGPDRQGQAVPQVVVACLRARRSWRTCCSPTSSTAGPPGGLRCRSRRSPPTRGSPARTSLPNGQLRLGRRGGLASILDAAVKALSQSGPRRRLADADGGHCRPAGCRRTAGRAASRSTPACRSSSAATGCRATRTRSARCGSSASGRPASSTRDRERGAVKVVVAGDSLTSAGCELAHLHLGAALRPLLRDS